MIRRKQETYLPGWLWFFLILPLGLIVALLYRQKRLNVILQRLRAAREAITPGPRYVEPDSIPIDVRGSDVHQAAAPFAEVESGEMGVDEEDVATARVRTIPQEPAVQETPTRKEEPTTGEPDDLKIIEGIGPSIAGILRAQGITTFRQLAGTSINRLDEILTNANLRRLADPGTWPEQAHLAADGKWDELTAFQGTLKAGRRAKTG